MATVQTVLGAIDPDSLGFTLTHEHCLVDASSWWKGVPRELWKRERFSRPVSLENRGEVIYNNFWFRDNLVLTDITNPIEELRSYAAYGGRSIVDVTQDSTGRDPVALRYIAVQTGVNIVMGSGIYIDASLTEKERQRSLEDTAHEIVSEFEGGVRDTGVIPGLIGEMGVSDVSNVVEMSNLRAAGAAQRKVGCGLNIHPPIWETAGHTILDVLEEQGADLRRVVLSHCDPTLKDREYHDSLAKRGCYIEYDMFGLEIMTHEGIFLPSDGEKIEAVKDQIERGNVEHILMSGDMCFKICFKRWGGWGYTHIPEHILPRMRRAGISDEQIQMITEENPKRLLAY
jgi:phosphotriesterase-related protein